MVISTIARSLLTRSVIKSGRQHAFSSSAVTSRYISNILLGPQGQNRLFTVSTRVASPAAAKRTTVKKSASKTPAKKKTTPATKKKARVTATKRKTTAAKKTKKVASKKRKVAAKKTRVTVRRRKVKKVVPKKLSPRTDASLRPPRRSISARALFVQRMWPSISPKPITIVDGMTHIENMWKALNATEKQPFIDEAAVITEQRGQAYDKWRAGLSLPQVRAINASRLGGKHNKLGRVATPGAPKKPVKGYVKFFSDSLKNGSIDLKNAPEGTRPIIYAAKEAGKTWKSMTPAQKQPYM